MLINVGVINKAVDTSAAPWHSKSRRWREGDLSARKRRTYLSTVSTRGTN